MSTRSIQKIELERELSELLPFRSPRVNLEQYMTPVKVAVEILWLAAYTYNDIKQKMILDLGSGTGIFGIGAALLGAKEVLAIDIDPDAVRIGCSNTERMGLRKKIEWVTMEIDSVKGRFDTVIQNPPFGTRKRGTDIRFLQKALEVGDVVYSVHKSGIQNREVIRDFIYKHDGRITTLLQNKFILPRTLSFHKRRIYTVDVDLYRIVRRGRKIE
ncbi:MAG: 50S ribosomal protein L11 methyltransferase [Candidatus Bathyarchaeota archaeon]|nr:MAG: 50S ribosomal protein L11 methyltransferase [Candidatus Bathyarchaeota archaeon]